MWCLHIMAIVQVRHGRNGGHNIDRDDPVRVLAEIQKVLTGGGPSGDQGR
jgi:hypothetical protein